MASVSRQSDADEPRANQHGRHMYFDDHAEESEFHKAWDSVHIVRPVRYSLFTFGTSELPYFLVCEGADPGDLVTVTQGEVKIKRPVIITPSNASPAFEGFFENSEEEGMARFLLSRSAHFSNLQFENRRGERKLVSDSVEEAVDRLNRRLDSEDEDRVAILTAPANLGGLAILRYTAERVWDSASDNIQELRERGFLP